MKISSFNNAKEMNIDDPKEDDIYSRYSGESEANVKIAERYASCPVEGLHRAEVIEFIEEENVVQVSIKTVTEEVEDDLESFYAYVTGAFRTIY